MEAMREILEAINMEVGGIMADWSDPRSECREILRLTAQALTLSSPHPEAREEDIRKALTTQDVKEAIGRFRGVAHFFDLGDMSAESDGNILADAIGDALEALSRLAAPNPEGQEVKQ